MITWDNFYLFATVSVCLWLIGAISALRSSGQSKIAIVLTVAGITCLGYSLPGYGYLCNALLFVLWVKPVCGIPFLWGLPGC